MNFYLLFFFLDLTQITFELHERHRGLSNEREYSLRIGFSPGAHDANLIDLALDSRHSLSVQPRKWISEHIELDEALGFLSGARKLGDEGEEYEGLEV
jgi:hypothetical protein